MEYYAERRLKRLGLLDDQGKTTWDGEGWLVSVHGSGGARWSVPVQTDGRPRLPSRASRLEAQRPA